MKHINDSYTTLYYQFVGEHYYIILYNDPDDRTAIETIWNNDLIWSDIMSKIQEAKFDAP